MAQTAQGGLGNSRLGIGLSYQGQTRFDAGSVRNNVDSRRTTAEAPGDGALVDINQGIRVGGGAEVRVQGEMSNTVVARDTRAEARGRNATATINQGIHIGQ